MNATLPFKSALLYFAIVFATGFALTLIRIPLLAPRFGVRIAELIKMPFMLIVIFSRHAGSCAVCRRPLPPLRGSLWD